MSEKGKQKLAQDGLSGIKEPEETILIIQLRDTE